MCSGWLLWLPGYMVVMLVGLSAVSASFIVVLLAAAFLGPASAVLAAVIAEVVASLRVKTRPYAFWSNLLAGMLPALVAAWLVRALGGGHPAQTFTFYLRSWWRPASLILGSTS